MKKKHLFNLVLLALPLLFLSSCDKVIDLKLTNNTGLLIIEGNVINAQGGSQIVKLSTNVAFSATNTYPPVRGATVNVSNQSGNTYQFTEGPAGTYTTTAFVGTSGTVYQLAVVTGGKTYHATSTMPAVVNLDSVTYKDDDINNSNHKKELTVNYKDPIGLGNQYLFVVTVNGVEINRVFAFNDQYTDGRDVHQTLQQTDIDILAGDTVTVEMQCIDNPMYLYWDTLMQQGDNGPGGSVAPSNPPTNISPAVLGYFSAHTSQTKTIVVN